MRHGIWRSFLWPTGVVALLLLIVFAAIAAWLLTMPQPAFRQDWQALERPGDVDKGRLVFVAGDCASCHARPGQDDPLRLGGGMALASPYGTLHVPNISADPIDGIGRWRTVDLANALLSGVSPESRHLYPNFPYSSYAHMTIDDVIDLRAYLRTLPMVSGRAPPHELAFPFNIRRFIGVWKLLYLDRTTIRSEPNRIAAWNRGHYLVDAVGHCAECHSSRNLLGAIKEKTRFAGGRDPSGTAFVPNITPTGIGDWSESDIVRVLTDGRTPDLRTVGSSMAGVVENTRQLPEADRYAIAVYIKTLRPKPTAAP
jgi:mono/diheme cytochrome c family protein